MGQHSPTKVTGYHTRYYGPGKNNIDKTVIGQRGTNASNKDGIRGTLSCEGHRQTRTINLNT